MNHTFLELPPEYDAHHPDEYEEDAGQNLTRDQLPVHDPLLPRVQDPPVLPSKRHVLDRLWGQGHQMVAPPVSLFGLF